MADKPTPTPTPAATTASADPGRRPTAPAGRPIAEFQADLAQDVMRNYKQSARAPGAKFVMPGGRIVDATPYLKSSYRATEHATAFGTVGKWLTPEWEADHPGFRYAWPKYTDPQLSARIRTQDYTFLPRTALRDDCPLAYTETVGPKGEECIQLGDVVCVAVSPNAWERLFKAKEAMGVAAVAGNLEQFYAGVDQEGGRADHWVENPPR